MQSYLQSLHSQADTFKPNAGAVDERYTTLNQLPAMPSQHPSVQPIEQHTNAGHSPFSDSIAPATHLGPQHSSPHSPSLPHDMADNIFIRSGVKAGGNSAPASIILSGGATLAMMAGASHGVVGLDHALMLKLHHWPSMYHGADQVHHAINHLTNQLAPIDPTQAIQREVAQAIELSSLEAVMDPAEPNGIQAIKINVKLFAGAPTVSLYLTPIEPKENEKNRQDSTERVAIDRKEFSLEIPSGYLTVALDKPNTSVQTTDNRQPAYLIFKDKVSNTEFQIAKVDLPFPGDIT